MRKMIRSECATAKLCMKIMKLVIDYEVIVICMH